MLSIFHSKPAAAAVPAGLTNPAAQLNQHPLLERSDHSHAAVVCSGASLLKHTKCSLYFALSLYCSGRLSRETMLLARTLRRGSALLPGLAAANGTAGLQLHDGAVMLAI